MPAHESSPSTNAPFRFAAKRVFLTYPQCGELSKQTVVEFLRDQRSAPWYCVALEQHEDGGNHIHAYAEWTSRVETTDARYFDVDGRHPNVQSVRSVANVLKYIQKGGDFEGNTRQLGAGRVGYGEIIAESTGVEDFMERVVQHDPRGAVHNIARVREFAEWRFAPERAEYVPKYTEFAEPADLTNWAETNLGTQVIYPLMPILAV